VTRARTELDRVRSLIDDLDAVVWEADASGRFTFVSAGAKRLLGLPRAAWLAEGFRAERIHGRTARRRSPRSHPRPNSTGRSTWNTGSSTAMAHSSRSAMSADRWGDRGTAQAAAAS
jgi:PAS domain-containing protein